MDSQRVGGALTGLLQVGPLGDTLQVRLRHPATRSFYNQRHGQRPQESSGREVSDQVPAPFPKSHR